MPPNQLISQVFCSLFSSDESHETDDVTAGNDILCRVLVNWLDEMIVDEQKHDALRRIFDIWKTLDVLYLTEIFIHCIDLNKD